VTPRPTIAVLYRLPLLVEALRHALEDVGEVRAFATPSGDPLQLLEALAPDAVVVDSERDAEAALAYAAETHRPALYIPWPELTLQVARATGWEPVAIDLSPEVLAMFLSDALRVEAVT
jgi:hypothetical protein